MEYGLVLAGGGVRGAYQIGVWKALKELKIKVSAVSGTPRHIASFIPVI